MSPFREATNGAPRYARGAIQKRTTDWVSDGVSGHFLPLPRAPFCYSPSQRLARTKTSVHINAIFEQMAKKPDRFAIGEAGHVLKEDVLVPSERIPHLLDTRGALCVR